MKVRDSIKAHEGDEPLHGTLMEIYSAIEYLGKYIHPHIKQERDTPLSDDEKNILRDYCKKRPEDPNYIVCNEKILVLKYKILCISFSYSQVGRGVQRISNSANIPGNRSK